MPPIEQRKYEGNRKWFPCGDGLFCPEIVLVCALAGTEFVPWFDIVDDSPTSEQLQRSGIASEVRDILPPLGMEEAQRIVGNGVPRRRPGLRSAHSTGKIAILNGITGDGADRSEVE